MARPFPWKAALTAGGVTLTGLGALWFFGRRSEPGPIGRVALIGDSYAVGLGPELEKLLPDFRYEGRVGTNTWQWAAHSGCGECGDWLTAFKPRVVLVSLGVNDGATPNLVNYQTIVQGLHGIGAHVVWIEPPAAIGTASRAMIAALGVQTVPATTTPLAADSLHPLSYRPWAEEIVQVLRGA